MLIDVKQHELLARRFAAMDAERLPWFSYWGELAQYLMPRRYVSLTRSNFETTTSTGAVTMSPEATLRNGSILDGTGTTAAKTLAAGMMNGITSPARPWFRLRVGFDDPEVRKWLDECQARMLYVMAETNFYNAMATFYLDFVSFATAAMMIYEDEEDVFRCYGTPLGEFFVQQDNRKMVSRFARKFVWRLEQIVNEFGYDELPDNLKIIYDRGGANLSNKYSLCHVIEPNNDNALRVPKIHKFREIVYLEIAPKGSVLRLRGFRESPAICARWEVVGNDSYGTGPAMDALPDIKQLQHMTKRKAQAIDKMVSPPMIADMQLMNRPTALLPNGITYVSSASAVGMKPAYQVNPPVDQMSRDIADMQVRIREIFHNDLFRMISQLDTVRTATEIDARREEKLVLLGPVLERFENEVLDPALTRIFNIMLRRRMLPPPPPSLADANIEIQYISVLSDAQRAVGAAPLERYIGFLGNIAGVKPEALEAPDWPELILGYAERLGVPAKYNKSLDQFRETLAAAQQSQQAAGAAEAALPAAQSAKLLSETQVGGGANALSVLLGGG